MSAPSSNILTRAKIWLKEHEVYVAYTLGFVTFFSLKEAALNGRWIAARLSPTGLFWALIVVAVWLYILRNRARSVYGCLECLAAFCALFSAAHSAAHLPTVETASMRNEWLVKAFGGIYVLVRGMDNIGTGLKPWLMEQLRELIINYGHEKLLACQLGVSEALVSDWVAGRKTPTLRQWLQILFR